MKTVVLSLVFSALAAALLSSCNTVQGASRDVGAVIRSVSKPFHH